MNIIVTCQCGQKLQAPEALAGKRAPCPKCGRPLDIPVSRAAGRPAPWIAKNSDVPEPEHATQIPTQPSIADPLFASPPQNLPIAWADASTASPHTHPSATPPSKSFTGVILLGVAIAGGIGVLGVLGIILLVWNFNSKTQHKAHRDVARLETSPSIENASQQRSPADAPSSTSDPLGAALGEEEVRQLATRFEKAIETHEVRAAVDFVDWERLVQTACAGIDLPTRQQTLMTKGIRDGASSSRGLFAQLAQTVQKGGAMDLLRIHEAAGQKRAMFRFIDPETSGVNYLDFVFKRQNGGAVKIVDVFVFFSGEFLSQTLRRVVLPSLAQQKRGILDRLTRQESDFMNYLPRVTEMTDHIQANRHQQAMSVYRRLPPSLQKDKTFLMLRLRAAQAISEQEYLQTIEAFRKHHPRDQAVADMLAIDGFIFQKNFDRALASVDKLDRAVGGDPYLYSLRAAIYILAGKPNLAEQAIEKAVKALPDNPFVQLTKFSVLTGNQHYDQALAHLKMMDQRFEMQWEDFRHQPQFAGFVESTQYEQWLAHLRKTGR